jgi:hypothetical protein
MEITDHVGRIASAVKLLQTYSTELKTYLASSLLPVPPHHAEILREVAEQVRNTAEVLSKKDDGDGTDQGSSPLQDSTTADIVAATVRARIEAEQAAADAVRAARSHALAPVQPANDFNESFRVALGSRRVDPGDQLVARSSLVDASESPPPIKVANAGEYCLHVYEPELAKLPLCALIVGGKMSAKLTIAYQMMGRSRHLFEYMYVLSCGDLKTEREKLDKIFDDGEVLLSAFTASNLASLVDGAEETLAKTGVAERTAIILDFSSTTVRASEMNILTGLFKRANAAGVSLFVVMDELAEVVRWHTDFTTVAIAFNARSSLLEDAFKPFFSGVVETCDQFIRIFNKVVYERGRCLLVRREKDEDEKLQYFWCTRPAASATAVASSSAQQPASTPSTPRGRAE